MPFFLIFTLIFSYLKSQKGDFLPVGDDMASGARWRADVAHGTTAQMRRHTKATWQGRGWPTRGAGGAHRAWTRGRRPRVSTQVHADARMGRHVVGGWQVKGP